MSKARDSNPERLRWLAALGFQRVQAGWFAWRCVYCNLKLHDVTIMMAENHYEHFCSEKGKHGEHADSTGN